MALTAIQLYNAVTLGTGATPTSKITGTQFLPVATNTLTGNGVAFNYILTSGSTSPGPNASLNFRYAFSMTSYSGTTYTTICNATTLNIKAPKTINTAIDMTGRIVVPITGNYLYTWFDINDGLQAPITVTINAIPIAITNSVYDL